MENKHYNQMKELFKRNQDKKSSKNNNKRNPKTQHSSYAPNHNMQKRNGVKHNLSDTAYQREFTEVERVYMQHMHEIEKEIHQLIRDVQYLDSKNPVVSSQMKKILVELITNAWIIGNSITNLKKENELAVVNQLLQKYEKRYLKHINDSGANPTSTDELKSIKMCQNIISDSLHQINSAAEYYSILMSKLSGWGFEIKNPIGQKYDVHMDINILAFEDSDPNLEEPTITETLKPEIYLNGNKLARAQVIVTKAGGKRSINTK